MKEIVITTAGRTTPEQERLAQQVALDLGKRFVRRNKQSVSTMIRQLNSTILVIGKERFEWHAEGDASPFFFHPNTSAFRMKRMSRGEVDPLAEAAVLQPGDCFLDCTAGMASDAIVASYCVGKTGTVTALEMNPVIAYLLSSGLQHWMLDNEEATSAMRRVNVLPADHTEYLKQQPDRSVDVVYFDPMYSDPIMKSDAIAPLRQYAHYETDLQTAFQEAVRIARKRVVLKDHFRSPRFEEWGMTVLKRPSSKTHFAYYSCE